MRSTFRRLVAVSVLSLGTLGTIGLAQEPAKAPNAPAAAVSVTKVRHFLPAYWSAVVTKAQREACYAIQDKYAAKSVTLAEIKTLKAEQLAEMTALLTPKQREQIERVKVASKAASAARKEAIAKALESK